MTKGVRGRVAEDLRGSAFNRLTVMERDTTKARRPHWMCRCDCGSLVSVASCDLKSGHTKSCGCWNAEDKVTSNTTHGYSRTPTYISWTNMRNRCTKPSDKRYSSYGGRGIKVCESWMNSFEEFLSDMGEKPKGMTLERIDVNGNYEPGNCKWATPKEQANNWRKSLRADYKGESFTAMQLSEMLGVNYERVVWAIKRYGDGWHDYIVRAAAEIGRQYHETCQIHPRPMVRHPAIRRDPVRRGRPQGPNFRRGFYRSSKSNVPNLLGRRAVHQRKACSHVAYNVRAAQRDRRIC